MRTMWRWSDVRPGRLAWACLGLLALSGCEVGDLPQGWAETPSGSGATVVWDLGAEPLPEIPLPNDIATWPDPTSPTGRRVNASMVAPTTLESRTRALFDTLDGWGTFAPITVRFDAPLDLRALERRQGGDRLGGADWPNHAIYLVDLETGEPVPVDIRNGGYWFTIRDKDRYWDNDYHQSEPVLYFETRDEDLDGDGELDPGEDTDFDGVLDRPNTLSGGRPARGPLSVEQEQDLIDDLLTYYERETNTLILRPLVPLRPGRTYAVVLTDRLRGEDGNPVRSPFPYVHPLAQKDVLAPLPDLFARYPEVYGSLSWQGWSGVAFAWTFTTQTVHRELDALREGLYGRGPFAWLAEAFPADLKLAPLGGGTADCEPGTLYAMPFERLDAILQRVGEDAFGLDPVQLESLLDTYRDSVSHVVFGFFETPYLLGDPDELSVWETWQLDVEAGTGRITRDQVPMLLFVPKTRGPYRPPFPVVFYGHGYTSQAIESVGFAGHMARHGLATAAISAQGHGLGLPPAFQRLLDAVFRSNCVEGFGRALLADRAVDQDGDGTKDSAGDFWTSYVFHTRDVVRQSLLDHIQAIRILRHFGKDGRLFVPGEIDPKGTQPDPFVFSGDVDGDGELDLAGDFDGDGTPDVGGWDNAYYAWGQSLGGILSGGLVGAEPAVVAAAPTAGAGGLIDVGVRSMQGGVREAVILRTLGPLVVGVPSEGLSERSACGAGQISLRFVMPTVNRTAETEFACLDADELGEGDVVVVRNLRSKEVRCAALDAEARFRINLPADTEDPISVAFYEGGGESFLFGASCTWMGSPRAAKRVVETWEVGNGEGAGACSRCATYEGRVWERGERLVTPTEGFGLPRQTPDFRRFLGLAQIALEPADPVNFAPRIFLRPIGRRDVADGEARPRNVLDLNTAGDQNVPVSAGNAYARAAGILPFMPPDAPDVFREYRAPAFVESLWGVPTPHDVLERTFVLEGVARMERAPVPDGPPHFLFDVDDLSEGSQWFAWSGGRQADPAEEDAWRPNRLDPPLRWVRASRPMGSVRRSVWRPDPIEEGMSGVLNAYIKASGRHGFGPIDPSKVWDEGRYLANLLGWYFASQGRELKYYTDPDGHHCLEEETCHYGR